LTYFIFYCNYKIIKKYKNYFIIVLVIYLSIEIKKKKKKEWRLEDRRIFILYRERVFNVIVISKDNCVVDILFVQEEAKHAPNSL